MKACCLSVLATSCACVRVFIEIFVCNTIWLGELHCYRQAISFSFAQDCVAAKGLEIDKVDERNVRLQEIMDELKVTEELTKLSHAVSEVEGKSLEVNDKEITVEKYMNAPERLALEKVRKEEEARKRASALDDQISRALGVSCVCMSFVCART